MIQIDMDKPKDCIWADITNHIYHCPLLNEYHKCNLQDSEPSTIKEQYERCPLHEVTADSDTVSRPQIHCKDCKHCYPPLTAVVDNEVKEVSDFRCSRMFGFTEADGWCYMFERKSSDG